MPDLAKPSPIVYSTPSDLEFQMTRVVEAPVLLVWDAHTRPEHVQQWMLGPAGWSLPVCEIDLREGGRWHFVWRRATGTEIAMEGRYREVTPPHRLVSTERWGPEWPETINTLALSAVEGGTLITSTMLFPSKEARDAATATGMTDGMTVSYDRLLQYLPTMG